MNAVDTRRPADLVRQIAVLSAVSFMLIAAMVGVGLFGGTAVQDVQGGALDSDGSYLAPAGSAFSIWSVIYVGLIAYAIWQALPRQRANERQRALGWLVALTAVLNGIWLVVAQFATLPLTVVAIVVLLAALAMTFRRAVVTRTPDDGLVDAVLLDGVTGLHLGWVTVATVANTAALLTQTGPASWESSADVWGVVVLLVVGVIGLGIAFASRWRVTPPLAIGWGLVWLGVARLSAEPQSTVIGVTAVIVAAIVVLVPLIAAALKLLRPSTD
ncbi:tryptophan-rich sensory protein [Microbacterium sp. P07]|uniref:tryptophan-rich sensory protein n=1 Tax=Microbacterium sp. P07 TaxID=3366952 RepID=UPI0037466002